MSKRRNALDTAVRVVFVILLALVGFMLTDLLFMLFFVPIVAWYIWRLSDRVGELEEKLAPPEADSEKEPQKK